MATVEEKLNKADSEDSNGGSRESLQTLLDGDPYLKPYEQILKRRFQRINYCKNKLTQGRNDLGQFASGHEYFGLHFENEGWVFREWAPNATEVYLCGDSTHWEVKKDFSLNRINNEGVWEIRLPKEALNHGELYRLHFRWNGGEGERIPAYARRVVQDDKTLIFNAQVWRPSKPYAWQCHDFRRSSAPPFILGPFRTHR